jgi:HD superfamily phosphodiesterase
MIHMSLYRNASFAAISIGRFNKIESFAFHYDWNLAFGGKSRGNQHLSRTVKLIRYLWEKHHNNEDLEKNNELLVELDVAVAGGLLHDIGLVEGNSGHCHAGRKIADGLLDELCIDEPIKDRILHCIQAHDGEIPARSIEAKLVHDADTIDKLGPLGAIRHIWKLCLLGEKEYTSEELEAVIPKHLESRYNNLYLQESRELADKLNQHQMRLFESSEVVNRLVNFIYVSARSGVPVDVMLESVLENVKLEPEILNSINIQLKLKFDELL